MACSFDFLWSLLVFFLRCMCSNPHRLCPPKKFRWVQKRRETSVSTKPLIPNPRIASRSRGPLSLFPSITWSVYSVSLSPRERVTHNRVLAHWLAPLDGHRDTNPPPVSMPPPSLRWSAFYAIELGDKNLRNQGTQRTLVSEIGR